LERYIGSDADFVQAVSTAIELVDSFDPEIVEIVALSIRSLPQAICAGSASDPMTTKLLYIYVEEPDGEALGQLFDRPSLPGRQRG
jgi:hypothetical protein